MSLPQPDLGVLRKAQRGDERAFSIIVRTYEQPVYNYVLRLTGDRSLSEDLTQEVFLRVFQGLPSFSLRSRFTTWLFQVTKNRVLDELRAIERRPRSVVNIEDAPPLEVVDAPAERAETIDAVWRAVEALNPDLKMALLLRDVVGLSYTEIAESLEITLATVKWRIYKAREEVQLALHRDGVVVPTSAAGALAKIAEYRQPADRRCGCGPWRRSQPPAGSRLALIAVRRRRSRRHDRLAHPRRGEDGTSWLDRSRASLATRSVLRDLDDTKISWRRRSLHRRPASVAGVAIVLCLADAVVELITRCVIGEYFGRMTVAQEPSPRAARPYRCLRVGAGTSRAAVATPRPSRLHGAGGGQGRDVGGRDLDGGRGRSSAVGTRSAHGSETEPSSSDRSSTTEEPRPHGARQLETDGGGQRLIDLGLRPIRTDSRRRSR